jgi:hypothetical protein
MRDFTGWPVWGGDQADSAWNMNAGNDGGCLIAQEHHSPSVVLFHAPRKPMTGEPFLPRCVSPQFGTDTSAIWPLSGDISQRSAEPAA